MNEQLPIGRVSIKDEESWQFSPSDIRTRAEAVTTADGRDAQQHLDDLEKHVNNTAIHSGARIKTMWEVTIPEMGWVQVAPLEADYPYSIEIPCEGTLDTHNAEVTVDHDYIGIAAECRLSGTMETLHEGLRFWAGAIPESEILCHMTLFGEGGISGGDTGGGAA